RSWSARTKRSESQQVRRSSVLARWTFGSTIPWSRVSTDFSSSTTPACWPSRQNLLGSRGRTKKSSSPSWQDEMDHVGEENNCRRADRGRANRSGGRLALALYSTQDHRRASPKYPARHDASGGQRHTGLRAGQLHVSGRLPTDGLLMGCGQTRAATLR